jgi:hypothetical protein
MKVKRMLTIPIIAGALAFVCGLAISARDKYTVKVPNGLSFSEFRGYEAWRLFPSVRTEPLLLRSWPIL